MKYNKSKPAKAEGSKVPCGPTRDHTKASTANPLGVSSAKDRRDHTKASTANVE